MDRALRAGVITKSGKAVETAGDIDVLLLDKTGTITIGNRKATAFHALDKKEAFIQYCALASLSDETPEGKSIVELSEKEMNNVVKAMKNQSERLRFIPFTAETRSSGVDLPDRSEEHTSELQSLMRISYAVFCLKKKN